jgi:hypothetical protein
VYIWRLSLEARSFLDMLECAPQARAASKAQGEADGSEEQAGTAAAPAEEAPAPSTQDAPSTELTGTVCNGKAAGKKRKHGLDTQIASSSKMSKQKLPGSSGSVAQQSNGIASASEGRKSYKWKKLAEKVLQARGGNKKMKARKLQLKVLSAAGLSADLIDTHGDAMLQRWEKSCSRFNVQDGYVSLKEPE